MTDCNNMSKVCIFKAINVSVLFENREAQTPIIIKVQEFLKYLICCSAYLQLMSIKKDIKA